MRHQAGVGFARNLACSSDSNGRRGSGDDFGATGQGGRGGWHLRRSALCRRKVSLADAESWFSAAVNGIVSFAHLYRIPLLMLISYRGSFGERDPWQTQGGNVTEALLRAMGIPYSFLDEIVAVEKRIRQAQALAESSLQPVALLLTRDLMWEE